jgi:hypothetical protein
MLRGVGVKCNTTMMLFIDYLFMVRRDVAETWRVSRNFEIYQESNHFLEMDNKIYLCVSAQEKILMFHNVGHNVKKLLGYNKPELRNAPISLMIPLFYIETHQKMVERQLLYKNEEFYALKKTILVRHFYGYYLLAHLELKMTLNPEGELLM